jgi:FkbM family methyltransferase
MKKLSEIIKFIGNLFLKFSKIIHTDIQENRAKVWYKLKDHKKLRFEYDLNKDSVVFDLGGYEGQWASDIYSRYKCKIFVFEPVKKYADEISDRFKLNDDIKVFTFGLADKSSIAKISLLDDSSSVFKNDEYCQEIELKAFSDFVNENKISKIDLMKINIEGGEYPLLEDLIATPFISQINDLQIQFHDFC